MARRPRRGWRLLLPAAAAAAQPALAAGTGPPDFGRRSAYANLSALLGRAGGCGELDTGGASKEEVAAVGLACALACMPHEAVLEEAFEPWWDHRLEPEALTEACGRVGRTYSQAFIGAVVGGKVLYKCCSTDCSQGEVKFGSGRRLSDLELILTLMAEVAEMAHLPDTYFLFNTGDQPFTDKVYWSPVPQFAWVRGPGHWTIPLPNPFQLKAHFQDLLGDGTAHAAHHIPWERKLRKVFWRGSLSAPDNLILADIETMPRIRLMSIAKQNPELFDVAITDIDSDLSSRYSKAQLLDVKRRLLQAGRMRMDSALPRFRYVICVSAVLSSWRLAELLASGSVLLLQEDVTQELIYEWLTPWEHFVPVSNSLSDLVPKVRWLEEHPELAEAIARQGLLQFQRRVRRQDTLCYIWQALRTMAHAMKPTKLPDAVALRKRGWTQLDAAKAARTVSSHVPLSSLIAAGRASEL